MEEDEAAQEHRRRKFAEFERLRTGRAAEFAPEPKPLILEKPVLRAPGKRYYDISFYVDSTSPEEWKEFLRKLSHFHTYVTICIEMKGRRVRYIIESDKYLENGNAIFHPFRVTATEKPHAEAHGFPGPKFVFGKEAVEFDSSEHVKRNRSADLMVLKVLLKPASLNLSLGKAYYSNGQSDFLLISNVHKFLSFSMLRTLDKQVEKVKAELKMSDVRVQGTKKAGALFAKEGEEFGIEDFDFFKHGLVVGQTGTGKSKFLELYVRGLMKGGYTKDCHIVFLDPHATVYKNLKKLGVRQIDFRREAVELFCNTGEPSASTEFTMLLFSAFLDFEGNPQLSRLFKHALFLLFTIKKMSFENLNLLLTDTMTRKKFVGECDNAVLKKFFDTEFMEFQTKKYDSTILPILNLINEYNLLSANIDKAKQYDLAGLISKEPVLFISTNPSELGKNMTRLIGGAMIQQVFTLLQSRSVKKKVILIVDEFSLVQNPAFAQILAEARKFGLAVLIAQQYLGQVDLEVLQSIQANVSNIFCFKMSRKDAEVVKKMMTLDISPVFESGKSFAEIDEKRIEVLTEANPRECIFRVVQENKYTRPLKARTVDVSEEGGEE